TRRLHVALLAVSSQGWGSTSSRCDRPLADLEAASDGCHHDEQQAKTPQPALQITPLAIRLFTEMKAISCTCAPRDWDGKYGEHKRCAGCERWWELHAQLHDEFGCRPWKWPCIQSPTAVCPYPPGSPAAQSWRPDESAQQMWQALARAAREARPTKTALEAAEAKAAPK